MIFNIKKNIFKKGKFFVGKKNEVSLRLQNKWNFSLLGGETMNNITDVQLNDSVNVHHG